VLKELTVLPIGPLGVLALTTATPVAKLEKDSFRLIDKRRPFSGFMLRLLGERRA